MRIKKNEEGVGVYLGIGYYKFEDQNIQCANELYHLLICLVTICIISSCNNSSTMDKKYDELTQADYKHDSANVDGDTIYFKTATSANTPQDFINLDNSQKLFIKHSLKSADTLIKKYLPNFSIDNLTPKVLDTIIDKWNLDSTKFSCSENDLINAIGTAFGFYLVKTYNMKWTMVTDEYGSDYATTISDIKLTNFPLNSVAKAIDQKREGSLQTISLMTKGQIEELKK
ncbi:MAG: DUF3806 domain-containing protein [Chitinophagaceae bacterium]